MSQLSEVAGAPPEADGFSAKGRLAPVVSLRILILLCLVLPVIAYAVVGLVRYKQIRAETEVRLDRALRIAEEHALKILDTNETVLARVLDAVGRADDAVIGARARMLHEQLREMTQNKPQIDSIWIHGADGRALVTDRSHPAPSHSVVPGREFFDWHRENRGLHLSEPHLDGGSGYRVVDMSRGRYLFDGRFAGVASIRLRPSYFENFYKDLAADEPGLAITMLRSDGRIFTRWPQLPNAPSSLSPTSPVMSRINAGMTSGTAHGVSSVDGRERLLAFSQVGDYPVFLGTGMDVREITNRWREEMAWLAAFGLPPLLGLLFAAGMALRRTRDALDAAQRLQEETLARRRVEEALLQAQKLEALGRLTGGVAHDFNNALMVISNNLFLLKRKHPEADGPQAESIGRAIGSASKLTRQLLAFSRRQALVPEYLKLAEQLPALKDMLSPLLGSQIEVSVSAQEDTPTILVDSAELELALLNLAINARDAMPAGGRFSIVARTAIETELPPTLQGPMVVVEAVDTGVGISPDALGKVFEPFFTTKPVGEGTGLGLSQVYGLCQRAGGSATIDSAPDIGTTVRLFFPALPDRPVQAAARTPATQFALGKTVLLVEDNDDVASALTLVLEELGCSATRLDRASVARDWLARRSELPDLLLTDVVMPGEMDGLALAQHARATYVGLDVILMSGYAEQLETISSLGFEIVPKPCSAEMLAAAIRRVSGGDGPSRDTSEQVVRRV